MPPEELDAELRRLGIDPRVTIKAVTAILAQSLAIMEAAS